MGRLLGANALAQQLLGEVRRKVRERVRVEVKAVCQVRSPETTTKPRCAYYLTSVCNKLQLAPLSLIVLNLP
jgi:hypothetical protein